MYMWPKEIQQIIAEVLHAKKSYILFRKVQKL